MMDIRRSLLMMLTGGGGEEFMNKFEITVESELSTTADIVSLINSTLSDHNIPSLTYVIVLINKTDRTQWADGDFIGAMLLYNQASSFIIIRSRSSGSGQYLQGRTSANSDSLKLYQGQKVTFMYA